MGKGPTRGPVGPSVGSWEGHVMAGLSCSGPKQKITKLQLVGSSGNFYVSITTASWPFGGSKQ